MPIYIARCADGTCITKHGSPELQEPQHLAGSVGEGGANIAADVRNVQARLNRVVEVMGGPATALVVDGSCGSKTKQAILRFQKLKTVQKAVQDEAAMIFGYDEGQAFAWKKGLTWSPRADEWLYFYGAEWK